MINAIISDKTAMSADETHKVTLQNMLRPSTVSPFALSHEEKGVLVNPKLVLDRLDQYVINNKQDNMMNNSTSTDPGASQLVPEMRKK